MGYESVSNLRRRPYVRMVFVGVFFIALVLTVTGLFSVPTASASTGVEQQMSFEGKIVNSTGQNIADGSYNMEFKIYSGCTNEPTNNTGCTLVWTEDHLVSNSGNAVSFTSGTYQVNLGQYCPLSGGSCTNSDDSDGNTNSAVNWNSYPLYVSLQIGNTSSCTPGGTANNFTSTCGGDGEMSPYILLTSAPYALNSNQLGGISASGFVQTAPGATQTIQPTANATGLIVEQNTGGTYGSDIFDVQGTGGSADNFVQVTSSAANTGNVLLQGIGSSSTASVQAGASGTINIGTVNTNTVNVGTVALSSGTETVSIGTGATSTGADAVTIGSTNGSSTTNIVGGASGTLGTPSIGIGNSASNQVIEIGTNGLAVNTVYAGSLNGASATVIQGGTGGISILTGNNGSGTAGNVSIDTGTSTSGSGSVLIGTSNAGTITIGKNNVTGNISLKAGGGTVNVSEDGADSNVINLSNSNFSASSKTYTINIGNVASVGANTSDSDNVTIGAAATITGALSSTTTIQAQGIADTLTGSATAPSDVVQSTTNSTAVFQIQNASGTSFFTANSTNNSIATQDINVGAPGTASGAGKLFTDGFESGNFKLWNQGVTTTGTSTASIVTSPVRDGKYAANITMTGSGLSYVGTSIAGGTTVDARAYVYITSQGSQINLVSLVDGPDANEQDMYLDSTGHLCWWNGAGTGTGHCSTSVVSTGTWHEIELDTTVNASTGSGALYLDGTLTSVNLTGQNTGSNSLYYLFLGDSTAGRIANYTEDDVSVDNARPGTSAELNVGDSLHVDGSSSFAGPVLIQPAANTMSGFQVENNAGTNILNVDTAASAVNIGGVSSAANIALNVNGAIQQTGLTTPDTNGTYGGDWTEIASCNLTIQYTGCSSTIVLDEVSDGDNVNHQATIAAYVYQQNAMGSTPFITLQVNGVMEYLKQSDFEEVTTTNTSGSTVVQLFVKNESSYGHFNYTPLINNGYVGWTWTPNTTYVASLPAGTQTNATYGDTYANTLTVETASNSATAMQIQNSNGASGVLFNADTTNMRISVGSIGTATGQLYVAGSVASSVLATTSALGGNAYDIKVIGNYAYIATNSAGRLVVYDVSNPASPALVGAVNTTAGNFNQYLAVAGKYAYVSEYAGTSNVIQVFDISNRQNPTAVASVATANKPNGIYISGRYLYLLNDGTGTGSNTLQVFDISNPAQPVSLGTTAVTAGTGPQDVYVQGRYAYVTSYTTNGFQVFDISNPAAPSSVGTLTTGLGKPYDLFVQGRYAYITNDNSGATPNQTMQVIDVSNPAAPTITGTSAVLGAGLTGIFVQGRYAYVTSFTSSTFTTLDISNPASPTVLGTPLSLGTDTPLTVFVSGRYAYMGGTGLGQMQVVDLGGEYAQQLQAGGTETGTLQVDNNSTVAGDESVGGGLSVGGNTELNGSIGASGSATFQDAVNSTTAFQIQTSTGNNFFTADSSNKIITTQDMDVGSAANISSSGRLFSDGFEGGNLNFWTGPSSLGTGSTIAASTSVVRNGKYAAAITIASNVGYVSAPLPNQTGTTMMRAYVYVASSGSNRLLGFEDAAGHFYSVRTSAAGNITFTDTNGTTTCTSSTNIAFGQWNEIELDVTPSATAGTAVIYINGTNVNLASCTTQNISSLSGVEIGETVSGNTGTFYVDDVSVDTVRPSDSASLSVNDSLHVGGTSTFGNNVQIQNAASGSNFNVSTNTTVLNENMVTTQPIGTFNGQASWSSGNYVELNSSGPNQDGEIAYSLNDVGTDWDAKFNFESLQTGTAPFGDGAFFFASDNTIPASFHLGSTYGGGAYEFGYDELTGHTEIDWNGTAIATSTGTYTFNNSVWHTAEIIKSGTTFTIYFDGTSTLTYTDSSRTLTGTYFGVGGCSCTDNGEHRVKNLVLTTDQVGAQVSTIQANAIDTLASGGTLTLGGVNTTTINIGGQNTSTVTIGQGNAAGTVLVLGNHTGGTTPTEVDGGIYYDTTLNAFRCGQNGSWLNCVATAQTHNLNQGGTAGSTTSTSYVNMPGTPTLTFTKASGSTNLLVSISTGLEDNAQSTFQLGFSITVGGVTTNYECMEGAVNTAILNIHLQYSCSRMIASIAAGSITVKMIWLSGSSSATIAQTAGASGDWDSFTAQETN